MEERYVIKNNKLNVYFKSLICEKFYHFVKSINDAKQFKNEEDAKKVLQELNNNEKYEIVKC